LQNYTVAKYHIIPHHTFKAKQIITLAITVGWYGSNKNNNI